MSSSQKNKVLFMVISEDANVFTRGGEPKLLIFNPIIAKEFKELPAKLDVILSVGLIAAPDEDDTFEIHILDPKQNLIHQDDYVTAMIKEMAREDDGSYSTVSGTIGIPINVEVNQEGIYTFRLFVNETSFGEQIFRIIRARD